MQAFLRAHVGYMNVESVLGESATRNFKASWELGPSLSETKGARIRPALRPTRPLCIESPVPGLSTIDLRSVCLSLRANFRIAASLDRKRLGAQFWGWSRILIRGVFDKDVRRKPLAFAADAVTYGN